MGNQQSSSGNPELREEAKVAKEKFTSAEIQVIRQSYKDLVNRTAGQSVDKATFLKYFVLPGLIGERLFATFDRNDNGAIEYEEFLCGLAALCRGSREEKMRVIFSLYDIAGQGSVSYQELLTMLNHFPKSMIPTLDSPTGADEEEAIDPAASLATDAFTQSTVALDQRLSLEKFSEWCNRTPVITDIIMNALPYDTKRGSESDTFSADEIRTAVLPFRNRRSSHDLSDATSCASLPEESEEADESMNNVRQLVVQARNVCQEPTISLLLEDTLKHMDDIIASKGTAGGMKVGYLWKRGNRMKRWKRRYYYLQGNFLYYFSNQKELAPRGVILLTGCVVRIVPDAQNYDHNGYHGFEIYLGSEGGKRDQRILYARTDLERKKWMAALQHASCKPPIEDVYTIGEELGSGRFSQVVQATHRVSGETVAVKIINKNKVGLMEKELLRTEIAILKLVEHPNIIRLKDIYENKTRIFIVTELLSGGELFNRIIGHSRYAEQDARSIVKPLLESVAYLHSLGIIHRDIKPENILCGESFGDLRIADFGLSQLVSPHEIMKMPCGTLNYVAPEVLSLNGYDKAADLWSVGVIMFLLLQGRLPFDGTNKNEIIEKTIRAELHFENISETARDLLCCLLQKDPDNRISARKALQHPWLQSSS